MLASAALAAATALSGVRARADAATPLLGLSIDIPSSGAPIGDPLGLALVSGRVIEAGPGSAGLDLMLAIDTSHSTARAAGSRRGWRRWLARLLPWRTAPAPESALDIEVERALELLESLEAGSSRVGVVAFAGDHDPRTSDAWTAAALGERDSARRALHDLSRRGASGGTNLIDALERARVELLGEPGAESRARPDARRALALLTDGTGVHPLHPEPREARALLRRAAARLCAAGVELDVIALSEQPALDAIAEAGGRVHTARGLPAPLDPTDRAEVALRNATSGARASAAQLPDGRFAALVPLAPGANAIEIRARSRSGLEARTRLDLVWSPGAWKPDPPQLLRIRNDLLAAHLRALRARRSPLRQLAIEASDAAGH
jgi:hypothetical protein